MNAPPHTRDASPNAVFLPFDDPGFANTLFGPQNHNLHRLAHKSGLQFATRGNAVTIKGDPARVALARSLLTQLYRLLCTGTKLQPHDMEHAWSILERNPETKLDVFYQDITPVAGGRKTVMPKTLAQREYITCLNSSDMTFAVGPAGTGKTYLAVAVALSMLLAKRIKRLILTRPAVEAGERLGFLPGDLAEKINPYLRPLYDALHDLLNPEKIAEMTENGIIEIAPLAFMRGRTLNNAFIILDEAQNTTPEQMKMFTTRLGFGSRAAITGDITQIDLPVGHGKTPCSGLVQALDVLKNVEGLSILHFSEDDVIRHPLVGRIVHAYDHYEKNSL